MSQEQQLRREQLVTTEPLEAMAGVLDIDAPGDGEVPELWHWLYFLDRPPTRDLGADGHPLSGIPAPPAKGMRRMFAGGRVDTHRRLRLDRHAARTTRIAKDVRKQGRSGPLHIITVRHEITQDDQLAISEEQDIVYRSASGSALPQHSEQPLPAGRQVVLTLDVDERTLFRFSALTYNAHRIHYDREWCRAEGYGDLVVHGPLQALMMGELARRNGVSLVGRRFDYRLVSPMIGSQTLLVLAGSSGLADGAEVRTTAGIQTAVSRLRPLPGSA